VTLSDLAKYSKRHEAPNGLWATAEAELLVLSLSDGKAGNDSQITELHFVEK